MKGYIIDPENQAIEEKEFADIESVLLTQVAEVLGNRNYQISFFYPTEFRTCTAYHLPPEKKAPFFRVNGFVDKVRFGKTVVLDKTATGFPKCDKVTLAELKPMIRFFY